MRIAEYFVRRGDTERGPTTAARLRELAAQGKLSKDDVIRRGENGDWFRAGDIVGLFDPNGSSDPDDELIVDPLVNLAGQAVGTLKRAAGSAGKAAMQIGGKVTTAIARKSERPVEQPPQLPGLSPEESKRLVAAEPAVVIDAQIVDETALCPFCHEPIKKAAKKCKHCGEILDVLLRQAQQPVAVPFTPSAAPVINISNVNTASPTVHTAASNVATANAVAGGLASPRKAWSPLLAAFLSLLIPGLGQLYKGNPIRGVIWFFVVLVAYAAAPPAGLVLHFCCIIAAAMGNPYR